LLFAISYLILKKFKIKQIFNHMKKATLLFLLLIKFTTSQSQFVSIVNKDTSICLGNSVSLSAITSNLPLLSNTYSVNQIGYSPDNFIGSNIIYLNDDDQTLPITLPFKFCFFGISYSKIIIASNGWAGFSTGQPNNWAPAQVPNNSGLLPMNCIMAPLQDLDPHSGGTVSYAVYGVAPNRRFVISYNNVPYYQNSTQVPPPIPCNARFTGQIKLFESSNKIETQIQNKPICSWNNGTSTHALHDVTGANAITANGRNYSVWTAINEAFEFVPSGASSSVVNWFCGSNLIGTGNTINFAPSQNCNIYAVINYGCGTTGEDTSQLVAITVSKLGFAIPEFIVSPISCNGAHDGGLKANYTNPVGNVKFLWSTTSTNNSITALATGNYTCSITDDAGCSRIHSFALNEPQKLSIQTAEVLFPKCSYTFDGKISVIAQGGTAPYLYQWSNGYYTNKISNLPNGAYSIYLKDAHQCTDSLSITINTPEVKISAGPDRTIGPNETTILHADVAPSGSYGYLWIPNYQLNANNTPFVYANPHKNTIYNLVVTSSGGCVYKDSVVIKVRFDENINIYNAFTPNNDGQNDFFTLKKYNDLFILESLNVYNRWGKQVYSTNDINQGWDGTFNGIAQEVGSYMYEATVKDFEGQPHILKGSISLLR
jgi:gliding motility-associated-like protein